MIKVFTRENKVDEYRNANYFKITSCDVLEVGIKKEKEFKNVEIDIIAAYPCGYFIKVIKEENE